MGKERATTMMSLLPPVGWGDVATKRDLGGLDAKIDSLETRLNTKIESLETRLNTKIDNVEERINAKVDHLALSTKADLQAFRSDLQRTFVTWMFAAQGAAVAAIGLMLAVTR